MNKRNPLLLISLVVLAAFLFSCASTHPNAKILVGSWKPESAEKYIDPAKAKKEEQKKEANADSSKMAKNSKTPSNDMTAEQKTEAEWARMVNTEKRTPLVVKADNTLEKTYHNKTIKGTWKLKRHGTRIIMVESTTGQKLQADILEISDTTIVVVERLPVGDIKVKYIKQH
jgi:hypothetical protein